ncbi:TPA: helix-turn-helix transcriptional regulator [Stenotrophomonas maltophilia]|uniref:helix-turn-helix transcriptional regulator n=1 Tax=Stenotrophomonas maltophilia TaxID=40324 RepID=UPI0039C44BCE
MDGSASAWFVGSSTHHRRPGVMQNNSPKPLRMLRRAEVQARLGIARSTLYGYLNKRSPSYLPSFPKPLRLGTSVLFLEHEIDDFVVGLIQAREVGQR